MMYMATPTQKSKVIFNHLVVFFPRVSSLMSFIFIFFLFPGTFTPNYPFFRVSSLMYTASPLLPFLFASTNYIYIFFLYKDKWILFFASPSPLSYF